MKLRNLEKNVQGFQLKIIDNELISRLIQTIKFNNGENIFCLHIYIFKLIEFQQVQSELINFCLQQLL